MSFSPLAGIRYSETSESSIARNILKVSVPLRGLDIQKQTSDPFGIINLWQVSVPLRGLDIQKR